MKNIPLLAGTLLATIALIIGFAVLLSRPEAPKIVDTAILIEDGRPVKGPQTAKVTIVEFSDLQCPACKAVQPLVQSVITKYPNDVRIFYRHYPLPTIHKNAQAAAQAADAAYSVNKFWEMHDLLFETQEEWAELDGAKFSQKLEEYAQKLAIDKSTFQKKMESKEVKDTVAADVADGNRAGIDSTPTFFVNGQLTPAPQLLSTVESLLSANK